MNLLSLALAVTTAADSQPKKPDYSPPAGAPYTAVNVTVPTDRGYTLAGTLTLPKGASRAHPVPAIVTITGSGPQDRDEMSTSLPSYRPFRQLADSLGRRGIAVLRMDDRGVGASGGKFKGTTDEGFRDDVRSGLAFLRTRSEIDTTRLGLVGHSEGALIAPMVALQEPSIRAVVLLAGGSRSLRVILEYQLSNGIKHNAKLSATQKDSALAQLPVKIDSIAATDPWWSFILSHDFTVEQKQLAKPAVLILTGANDQQATPDQNPEIAAHVRSSGNTDVTARIIPGVNHLFVRDSDGFPGGYAKLPTPLLVESGVIGIVADWLVSKLRS
jgi:dienelactone hydrolase